MGSARQAAAGGDPGPAVPRLHPQVSERWLTVFSAVLAELSAPDAHGLEGTAQLLAAHGAAALPGAQCVISITTPENPDTFTVVAGDGEWASQLVGSTWPVEGTLHGRAMHGGVAVESTQAPAVSSTPWVFFGGAIETGRLVPLRTPTPPSDGRIGMGVISFWRPGQDAYSDDDRLLMDLLAQLAGVLIQRAELLHSAVNAVSRLTATVHDLRLIQDAANTLSSTLDLESIYEKTANAASRLIPGSVETARRATVMRIDGENATIVAEQDATGVRLGPRSYAIADYEELRRVMETGKPYVHDLRQVGAADGLVSMHAPGILWAAMVPIYADGRVAAILRVSSRYDEPFDEDQQARLVAIASVAELAVGNAQRYLMLQQEAQRASELENVKSEFLKLASHELRGPVGVVRGYLAMFEDGSLPSVTGRARDVLPVLVGKMSEINGMVDDMLETARLEEGRLELRKERLDLRVLAEDAMRVMRPLASANHKLTLSTGDVPVEVVVDPGRVSTIITNLIQNAIKYSPRGGPVNLKVATADEDWAVVTVTDRGIGIAPQHMSLLFTRFGRIVTTENSHILGTGLGLYLARELSRRHGGEIEARSRLGKGSTFTLRLPIAG